MAEDEKGVSPKLDPVDIETKEDAETRATRRELKQSSISDAPLPQQGDTTDDDKTAVVDIARPATPAEGATGDAENEDLKEQVASPKKKRAHDQLDSGAKGTQDVDAASEASTDSAKDRTSRSEPEKKRHRDGEPSDETTVGRIRYTDFIPPLAHFVDNTTGYRYRSYTDLGESPRGTARTDFFERFRSIWLRQACYRQLTIRCTGWRRPTQRVWVINCTQIVKFCKSAARYSQPYANLTW
jgi:hypothetical protein